ncbi:MAG TPA: hypothetical protein VFR23_18970, partial [Jiangellaceae bacterium]|nr:hypothetical protein [Jiangellaceae bacterium]
MAGLVSVSLATRGKTDIRGVGYRQDGSLTSRGNRVGKTCLVNASRVLMDTNVLNYIVDSGEVESL